MVAEKTRIMPDPVRDDGSTKDNVFYKRIESPVVWACVIRKPGDLARKNSGRTEMNRKEAERMPFVASRNKTNPKKIGIKNWQNKAQEWKMMRRKLEKLRAK